MKKHSGTRRPRLIRTLLAALAVLLVAFGLPLATMSAASAHTPNRTASCSGITVSGWYYESKDINTLGIRIDGGAWTTKTFAVTDSLTVPVPQDGLVHTYSAYVHTTNPNAWYSHDYSGTVGPCGNKHVTAVLWDKTDPTCATDGALVPNTEPTGITVTRLPASGTGPGHYVLTFVAQSGYTIDGPTSQTIDVLPKLTGDQCATEVQPVAPTITNPTCTGPGTGTPGAMTLPADVDGISYSKDGNIVTATADATHKFGTLPSGWTLVDTHHATYEVGYEVPDGYPACLVDVDVPTPPVASAPTCDTDGALVVAPADHVVTTVDGQVVEEETSFGPGKHSLSYAPAAGYAFGQGVQTEFSIGVQHATLDCPAAVVSPTVTQSVCTTNGIKTTPVVTLGDVAGDHVSYGYDAGTHVVTATPNEGFALANLPEGWTLLEDGTATYTVVLTDPGTCVVVSPPTSPTVVVSSPGHPAVLPNTGGPTGWLLAAALLLLAGGTSLVLRGRRGEG